MAKIEIASQDQGEGRRKKAKTSRAATAEPEADHRGLYAGLIRLHVLHHAVKEPVYGFAMIEELRRHGYELSTGTLYPILHGLEREGLVASRKERVGSAERRVYRATPAGRKALTAAKIKVRELFGELFEDEEEGGR